MAARKLRLKMKFTLKVDPSFTVEAEDIMGAYAKLQDYFYSLQLDMGKRFPPSPRIKVVPVEEGLARQEDDG